MVIRKFFKLKVRKNNKEITSVLATTAKYPLRNFSRGAKARDAKIVSVKKITKKKGQALALKEFRKGDQAPLNRGKTSSFVLGVRKVKKKR